MANHLVDISEFEKRLGLLGISKLQEEDVATTESLRSVELHTFRRIREELLGGVGPARSKEAAQERKKQLLDLIRRSASFIHPFKIGEPVDVPSILVDLVERGVVTWTYALDTFLEVAGALGRTQDTTNADVHSTLVSNVVRGVCLLLVLYTRTHIADAVEAPFGVSSRSSANRQIHPLISVVSRCPPAWQPVARCVREITSDNSQPDERLRVQKILAPFFYHAFFHSPSEFSPGSQNAARAMMRNLLDIASEKEEHPVVLQCRQFLMNCSRRRAAALLTVPKSLVPSCYDSFQHKAVLQVLTLSAVRIDYPSPAITLLGHHLSLLCQCTRILSKLPVAADHPMRLDIVSSALLPNIRNLVKRLMEVVQVNSAECSTFRSLLYVAHLTCNGILQCTFPASEHYHVVMMCCLEILSYILKYFRDAPPMQCVLAALTLHPVLKFSSEVVGMSSWERNCVHFGDRTSINVEAGRIAKEILVDVNLCGRATFNSLAGVPPLEFDFSFIDGMDLIEFAPLTSELNLLLSILGSSFTDITVAQDLHNRMALPRITAPALVFIASMTAELGSGLGSELNQLALSWLDAAHLPFLTYMLAVPAPNANMLELILASLPNLIPLSDPFNMVSQRIVAVAKSLVHSAKSDFEAKDWYRVTVNQSTLYYVGLRMLVTIVEKRRNMKGVWDIVRGEVEEWLRDQMNSREKTDSDKQGALEQCIVGVLRDSLRTPELTRRNGEELLPLLLTAMQGARLLPLAIRSLSSLAQLLQSVKNLVEVGITTLRATWNVVLAKWMDSWWNREPEDGVIVTKQPVEFADVLESLCSLLELVGVEGGDNADPNSPASLFRQTILQRYVSPLAKVGSYCSSTWFPIIPRVRSRALVALSKFPIREVEDLLQSSSESAPVTLGMLMKISAEPTTTSASNLLTRLMESELRNMRGTLHRGVATVDSKRLVRDEAEVDDVTLRDQAKEMGKWILEEPSKNISGVRSSWAAASILTYSAMGKALLSYQEEQHAVRDDTPDSVLTQTPELQKLNDLIRAIVIGDHLLLRFAAICPWAQYFLAYLPRTAKRLSDHRIPNPQVASATFFADVLIGRLLQSDDANNSVAVGTNLIFAVSGLCEALNSLAIGHSAQSAWAESTGVVRSLFDQLTGVSLKERVFGVQREWSLELRDAAIVAIGHIATQIEVTDERRIAAAISFIEQALQEVAGTDSVSYGVQGLAKLVESLPPSSMYFEAAAESLLRVHDAFKSTASSPISQVALAMCLPSLAASGHTTLISRFSEVAQNATEELRSSLVGGVDPKDGSGIAWIAVKAAEVGWQGKDEVTELLKAFAEKRKEKRHRLADPHGHFLIAYSHALTFVPDRAVFHEQLSYLLAASNLTSNSASIRSQTVLAILVITGVDFLSLVSSRSPNPATAATAFPLFRRLAGSPDVRVARMAIACLGWLVWSVLRIDSTGSVEDSSGRFAAIGGAREPRDFARLNASTSWLRAAWDALDAVGKAISPSVSTTLYLFSSLMSVNTPLPSVDWRPLLPAIINRFRQARCDPDLAVELCILEFAAHHARVTGARSLLDHLLSTFRQFFGPATPAGVSTEAAWRMRWALAGELGVGSIMEMGGLVRSGDGRHKLAVAASKVVEVVEAIVGWAVREAHGLVGEGEVGPLLDFQHHVFSVLADRLTYSVRVTSKAGGDSASLESALIGGGDDAASSADALRRLLATSLAPFYEPLLQPASRRSIAVLRKYADCIAADSSIFASLLVSATGKGAIADPKMAIVVLRGAHIVLANTVVRPAVRASLRDAFRDVGGLRVVSGKVLRDVVAQAGYVPGYCVSAALDHVVRTALLEGATQAVVGRLEAVTAGKDGAGQERSDWLVRALDVHVVSAGKVKDGECDPRDFVETFVRTIGSLVDMWWGIRSATWKPDTLTDAVQLVEATPWVLDARWRLAQNLYAMVEALSSTALGGKIQDRVLFLTNFVRELAESGVREGTEWAEDMWFLHKALQTTGPAFAPPHSSIPFPFPLPASSRPPPRLPPFPSTDPPTHRRHPVQMNYANDALTRLTGLSLDPEFSPPVTPPPAAQPAAASAPTTQAPTRPSPASAAPPTPAPAAPAEEPTRSQNDAHAAGDDAEHADEDEGQLTLRALVNGKEAGALIGKAGKNVAEIREVTGVKAGVSKVVEGVQERILTVSGGLSSVAKAFNHFSRHLVEAQSRNPQSSAATSDKPIVTVRLLVPHQQVGSIIGKGGARIREIQESSGARIVATKEMLPQSTERIIEVHGFSDSIQIAVSGIGESLIQDTARSAGTIYYKPEVGGSIGSSAGGSQSNRSGPSASTNSSSGAGASSSASTYESRRRSEAGPSSSKGANGAARRETGGRSGADRDGGRSARSSGGETQTATLSVPGDLVGCIIGRGGSIINEIRAESGSRISIAKESDPTSGQRTFTIQGTAECNQKALQLIYETLESEKERRSRDDGRDD
ncbi:RNA binding protein, heterogenous nuclear RNP-K like protein [Gonapodya sp. JEL0774]|nr:RNA binding protein, heterogenous nuclear RNP-K like protein [Gonapodya sp. JEL0774]